MKKSILSGVVAAVVVALVVMHAESLEAQKGRRRGQENPALGTVYVTSQGLYYDTFVSAETLPPHGRFQLLVGGETEFGPGDPGYLGGRWMIPNDQGGYDYVLCPLLGPGRETP